MIDDYDDGVVICSICLGSNLCTCIRHKSQSLCQVSAIIAERRAVCGTAETVWSDRLWFVCHIIEYFK